jgi:hypothetical protein
MPFLADNAYWVTVVEAAEITSGVVTVSITNVGAAPGFILADGAILYRYPGQPIPPGNSEQAIVQPVSEIPGASSGSALLRAEERFALDQALTATVYWDEDPEELAAVLTADHTRKSDELHNDPIPPQPRELAEEPAMELALSGWLT